MRKGDTLRYIGANASYNDANGVLITAEYISISADYDRQINLKVIQNHPNINLRLPEHIHENPSDWEIFGLNPVSSKDDTEYYQAITGE